MKKLICTILALSVFMCAFFQLIDLGTQVKGQLDLTTHVKGVLPFTNLPSPPYGTSGVFASIPATCATTNLYFATDKPPGANLYGCTTGNVWTLLSGGSGNMNSSVGSGAPVGICTVGQTFYINQTPTPKELWFCDTASGTYQKVISTLNTGDGRICLPGVTSGTACITVNDVAGTPNDLRLPTSTGGANQVLKTDGGSPQQLSWGTVGGAQVLSGLFSAIPTCNAQFSYITTDSALQAFCDSVNLFWRYKGLTVTPTVVGDLPNWFNQGGATISSSIGSWYLVGTTGVGISHGRTKAVPTPPYSIVTCLEGLAPNTPAGGFGMFWTDGTQMITAANQNVSSNGGTSLRISKWNTGNAGGFNSDYVSVANSITTNGMFCLAFIDDNTNRKEKISVDKKYWISLHSVGNTDFLTATQVGVIVQDAGTGTVPTVGVFSVETLNSAL
jgi:hypothetical protein